MNKVYIAFLMLFIARLSYAQSDSLNTYVQKDSLSEWLEVDSMVFSEDSLVNPFFLEIEPYSDSLYNIVPTNPNEVCPAIEDINDIPQFLSTGDSLFLIKGDLLILKDSAYYVMKDTMIHVPYGIKYKLAKNTEFKASKLLGSLQKLSNKYWWSSAAFSTVFSYHEAAIAQEQTKEFKKSENIYKGYEGKYIKSIYIRQVDVLEGTVEDTSRHATTLLTKLANSLHVDTHERIIRNNLMFEEGDTIFEYLISDNERLIRQLSYIQDCRIVVVDDPKDPYLVDVWVITEDRFSIQVDGNVSDLSAASGQIYDQNILGSGNELGYGMKYDNDLDPSLEYRPWFKARNIRGSFVDFNSQYVYNSKGSMLEGIVNRNFINQFTKYGFGISAAAINDYVNVKQLDSTLKREIYSYNYQDVWLGRQFSIGSFEGRKNFIAAFRVRHKDVTDRPYVDIDSNRAYHNFNFYLMGLTFKKINYYKNNYIYRYGFTEDLPRGYFVQWNFGYVRSEFEPRIYNGILVGFGALYKPIGYFAVSNEYGTYLNDGQREQGVLKFKFNYIANIVKYHRYKIRNLFYYTFVTGFNRLPGETINVENRVEGLRGPGLTAREASLFKYELVNFTPWNVYGFKIAVVTFADMAILHANLKENINQSLYVALGMGLRIRNEALAFRTIEISLAYLPQTLQQDNHYFFNFNTSINRRPTIESSYVPSVATYDLQ